MKKSKKIFITLCGIATTAILPVATISCNDDKLAEKNGKEKADAALKQANTLAEELKKKPWLFKNFRNIKQRNCRSNQII